MHVVRTIGQAFEVCNQFKETHMTTKCNEIEGNDEISAKKNIRGRLLTVNGHDETAVAVTGAGAGVSDESQDSDESLKDLADGKLSLFRYLTNAINALTQPFNLFEL